MKLYEFYSAVIAEIDRLDKATGECPNAICISKEKLNVMVSDYCMKFMPESFPCAAIWTLCGLLVKVSEDLHGDEFFVGKLQRKADKKEEK